MTENQIALHCPKCSERLRYDAAQPQPSDAVTCASCGALVNHSELKTASGKSLEEHLADMAREAFKGIKGFKPGP